MDYLHSVQTEFAAQPASYPMGAKGCFCRGKRPGRESDHSPPSSTEAKKDGAVPHSPIRLRGVILN
jgi:hypothetical protein